MKKQTLPPGYSEDELRSIAAYYENQSDEEAEAEIEAAFADPKTVFMQVPVDVAPRVRAIIDKAKRTRLA